MSSTGLRGHKYKLYKPQALELELELDASADKSSTDDNREESYSLYISPFVP